MNERNKMNYETKAPAIMNHEQFMAVVNGANLFAAVAAARTQSVPCAVVKAWVSAILAAMKK